MIRKFLQNYILGDLITRVYILEGKIAVIPNVITYYGGRASFIERFSLTNTIL